MKNKVIIALQTIFVIGLTGVFASKSLAQCTTGPCTLVWEDNFDGTSLDLNKWEYQTGNGSDYELTDWGNGELQYYRDGGANDTVSGGILTITAKQENFGGKNYTSARIRTRNQGDFAYGRFEARIQLPQQQSGGASKGYWPAFWLLPYNSPYGGRGWSFHGEIDIMEWVGHDPTKIHGTIHYPCCGPGDPTSANVGTSTTLASPTAFHEYAIEWEPGVIRWYLDDVLYQTRNSWSSGDIPYPAPFDVPNFHMILNLAVGANNGFNLNPDGNSVFPQDMKVDYVRVYDLGSTITPIIPPVTDPVLLDDFEHFDAPSQWSVWVNSGAGGGRSNTGSVPPSDGGLNAMDVGFGGIQGALWGTIYHSQSMDLSAMDELSFWINPTVANQDFLLEINIQDDDSGEGNWTPNLDDEFQYTCRVSSTGPCAFTPGPNGGWQKITIPLSSFTHDTSYATGGNGILDTADGLVEQITIAVVDLSGGASAANFQTDYWIFNPLVDTDGDGIEDGSDPAPNDPCIPSNTVPACDTDGDGVADGNDPAPSDPCNPSTFVAVCDFDTDGDGKWDRDEGPTSDVDFDGIPDYQESSVADQDGDLTPDETDPANSDPCIPSNTVSACDTDGDGVADGNDPAPSDPCNPSTFVAVCDFDTDLDLKWDRDEGELTDTDGDGFFDYEESSILDADGDGTSDELDSANNDPCIPSNTVSACDTDGDGVADGNDPAPSDPCNPSTFVAVCDFDTDGDGKWDREEGPTSDVDVDGTPDYQESSVADQDGDGTPDETDPANSDPCIPNPAAPNCVAITENVPVFAMPGYLLLAALLSALGITQVRRRQNKGAK